MFEYADDVWDFTVAAQFQRISDYLGWARDSDRIFEEELAGVGFGANESMQVAPVHVSRAGGAKAKWWLRRHAAPTLGG
eukprot:1524629-Pyramimonas_sp.AAC.1